MVNTVLHKSFVHALYEFVHRAHFCGLDKLIGVSQPAVLVSHAIVVHKFKLVVRKGFNSLPMTSSASSDRNWRGDHGHAVVLLHLSIVIVATLGHGGNVLVSNTTRPFFHYIFFIFFNT
jgi:hypothetical protein